MKKQEDDIGIKLLEEQELERKRIARELHDSTVQNLTMLIHKTELCSKLIDKDPIQAKLEMRMMSDTLRTSINEMREIIFDLRPMVLDDLGLSVALERFITQQMLQCEVMMELSVEGREPELVPVVKTTLFRIITEACNNALRHANPEKVDIMLRYEKDNVYAEIKDNGCGFEVEDRKLNEKSFGISIMKERAYLLKGSFQIESKKGKGTLVKIVIPNE